MRTSLFIIPIPPHIIPTSYACSFRFPPLLNLYRIARAGRTLGAFSFWMLPAFKPSGFVDCAPESSFPPRMRARELFVKWILLFVERSLRQPYTVRIIYGLPQSSNSRFYACPSIPRVRPHPKIALLAILMVIYRHRSSKSPNAALRPCSCAHDSPRRPRLPIQDVAVTFLLRAPAHR